MSFILSIDLGTSSIKTALIDISGRIIDKAEKPVTSFSPSPYMVEQDPRSWWEIIKYEVKEILSNNKLYTKKSQYLIRAIACCGHSPSMVFLDQKRKILRPSIIWQDRRAIREIKIIKNILRKQNIKVELPSPLTPYSRLAKLLWLKKNEPETIKNLHYLLEPKDYINYKLTGICSTSLWSSREFRNINTGELNTNLLTALKIRDNFIPRAFSSETIIGSTLKSVNQDLGLKEGIPVIAGEMDSISSIIGTGISSPFVGFNVSGTSDIIGIVIPQNSQFKPNISNFYHYPFFMDTDILFGVTQSTGQSVLWFNSLFKENLWSFSDNESLMENNPLFFLPFLEGSRSPHWNPEASGIFFGLNSQHNLTDLRKAIFQGIAFHLWENMLLIQQYSQLTGRAISIKTSGGGSRNHLLNQIKADVLGQKIIQTSVSESGLLGNTILAVLGLSIYNYQEAVSKMVHNQNIYYPDLKKHNFYKTKLFPIYQKLYLKNKSCFKDFAKLKNL